jgi:hypothetical protein
MGSKLCRWVVGSCNIELVKYEEIEPELFISTNEKQITTPNFSSGGE